MFLEINVYRPPDMHYSSYLKTVILLILLKHPPSFLVASPHLNVDHFTFKHNVKEEIRLVHAQLFFVGDGHL